MKLILLAGKKQSGKTTTAANIYAWHLTQCGVIPNASVDESGKIRIVYDQENSNGIVLDIDSIDPDLAQFVEENFWPHVKHAPFAYELKRAVANLFGLNYNTLNGTNEDKDKFTHIKWGDLAKTCNGNVARHVRENKLGDTFMTHRELLEQFGTTICRGLDDECHVRSAYNNLKNRNPTIGIISDMRFPNELAFDPTSIIPDIESITRIKFTRDPYQSDAVSERSLDALDESKFDLVVPPDLTVHDKNELVINFLIEKGVLLKGGVEIIKNSGESS